MRKDAVQAILAVLAGGALAWIGAPPDPAPPGEAVPAPPPAAVTAAVVAPATPLARVARPATAASLMPVVPPPVAHPAAPPGPQEPPSLPQATRAVSAPAELALRGHPEWTRRLLRWAGTDPDAALAWASQLSDPDLRREASQAVCFKVAEGNPRAALELAQGIGLEDEPGLLENLVAQWAAADAPAALDWIERRDAGEAREALLSRAVFALAASEPSEAVHVVEERMAQGPLQVEAAASALNRWWQRDAAAASDWVDGLPEGPLRERARRERDLLAAPRPR